MPRLEKAEGGVRLAIQTGELTRYVSRQRAQSNVGRFARWEQGPAEADDATIMRAVSRAQEGDTEALHFLYIRYADSVLGYVRSIVSDHHEAEDVTQNVFAKLMTAIRKYERRNVPFSAWILRVARNAALDHLRAKRLVPCEEVRTSEESHDQASFDRIQSLREALER